MLHINILYVLCSVSSFTVQIRTMALSCLGSTDPNSPHSHFRSGFSSVIEVLVFTVLSVITPKVKLPSNFTKKFLLPCARYSDIGCILSDIAYNKFETLYCYYCYYVFFINFVVQVGRFI